MSNPYSQSPNSNPYGGGPPSPDDRDPYGHGQGQPGPHTAPSRPAFVDPYQPSDRQPTYPPAVMLHELGQESTSSLSAASPQQARRPSPASGPSTTAARVGAVACLGLTFLMLVSHVGLLALGVTAVFFAVCSSALPKLWAANAFNVMLVYIAQVIVLGIVLGIVDMVTHGTLRVDVGGWIRIGFAVFFLISAVAAGFGKYFRMPVQIPVLPS